MDVGIVGEGINGLCCAWQLAEQGHCVTVYERDRLMGETSQTSSKLLHGGLRYLENGELRLMREAIRERDAWLARVSSLAWLLQLTYPIYRGARRPRWMVGLGLYAYDHIAGRSELPRASWISAKELLAQDPRLNSSGLIGGWRFWDGQMDDFALGLWVAERALPFAIDPVRRSHLVLSDPTSHAYLVEVPGERRIAFILPWKGGTLVGTTEVRQRLDESIACDEREVTYLSGVYQHYLPEAPLQITGTFAGLRPLIRSTEDPGRATREYALHREGRLLTVFGGKWTMARALAARMAQEILGS